MNNKVIRYILGCVLKIEAVFILVPCIVALAYRETEGLAYLATSGLCLAAGFLIGGKKPEKFVFYLREGCISTALSWIFMSIFGCLPFIFTGEIPSFTDALFETVSGFTDRKSVV